MKVVAKCIMRNHIEKIDSDDEEKITFKEGGMKMRPTKVSYKIIEEKSPLSMETTITMEMEKGWKPIGGICVRARKGSPWTHYYQAVVKDES